VAQLMTHAQEIGFIASALVLAAFGMKNMVNLRIVAICSNFAFIVYALLLHLLPVVAPCDPAATERLAFGSGIASVGLQLRRDHGGKITKRYQGDSNLGEYDHSSGRETPRDELACGKSKQILVPKSPRLRGLS
jgi:hypothetical protein